MWLHYGVSEDGALVFIDDVPKGKTQLHCPYCSGRLTAKKGTRKEHHFAHTGETCREVSRSTDIHTLPLFDKFHLELTGKQLEQLEKFQKLGHCSMVRTLESQKLLQWNEYKGRVGRYELTKLGKIPLGQLSLQLFNEITEPLIEKKLRDLQRSVLDAYDTDSPLLVEKRARPQNLQGTASTHTRQHPLLSLDTSIGRNLLQNRSDPPPTSRASYRNTCTSCALNFNKSLSKSWGLGNTGAMWNSISNIDTEISTTCTARQLSTTSLMRQRVY
ncbi:hypothetical protein NUACC26_011220 [Scytonema sp. NUACC26]